MSLIAAVVVVVVAPTPRPTPTPPHHLTKTAPPSIDSITRPLEGKTDEHYSFDPIANGATLNFISAIGNSQVFAYHKA